MNLTFRLLPLYQFILHHPTTLLLIILQLPSYSTKIINVIVCFLNVYFLGEELRHERRSLSEPANRRLPTSTNRPKRRLSEDQRQPRSS